MYSLFNSQVILSPETIIALWFTYIENHLHAYNHVFRRFFLCLLCFRSHVLLSGWKYPRSSLTLASKINLKWFCKKHTENCNHFFTSKHFLLIDNFIFACVICLYFLSFFKLCFYSSLFLLALMEIPPKLILQRLASYRPR